MHRLPCESNDQHIFSANLVSANAIRRPVADDLSGMRIDEVQPFTGRAFHGLVVAHRRLRICRPALDFEPAGRARENECCHAMRLTPM